MGGWSRLAMCALVGWAVLLLAGCGSTGVRSADRSASRPNIVVILTDDAGYGDFGFTGGTVVETPSLDAIAAEGARLTQFYTTASVCSPSRAGFITGRFQQRFGHHSNLTGPAARAGLGLPPSELTIADHLRARGYTTGLIGKWHLGEAEELLPTSRGFDVFEGLAGGSRSYFAIEGDDPVRRMRRAWAGDAELDSASRPAGGTVFLDEGAIDTDGNGDGFYATDWIGARAASFVRAHAGEDEPFFLFVSFTAPHTPMDAEADDLEAVSGIAPERRRVYAAMMRSLDRAVGGVTDAIDDAGIGGETLVMLFNDNGGATNNGSDNGRYRGMKGSKWEGGVRVPAAMRWRGVIEPGTVFTPIVSSMDFAATAVSLGGGPIAGSAPLDGVDLMPALSAGGPWADDAVRAELFWERGPARAVRAGPWKLVTTVEDGKPDSLRRNAMLYHIPADPSETTDLAAERPGVVADLLGRLEAWRAETVEPLWREGAKWERNQLEKHRPGVVGREAERKYP